jgi:methylase of polypeptide subunit release factors
LRAVATPNPDRAAAAALGAALRRVGYDEEALDELVDDEASAGGREEVLVAARRLPRSPLATVIRLLYLELPVPTGDAVEAIGRDGMEALETVGLVELADDVRPLGRLAPIGKILLASDGFTRDADDPPDYVASYTPTARTCDLLTPRPRGGRALDVGTGSGIHALLAARHSEHVVAVDVNPRALAYTALNAALNGFDNLECRAGSFFEPVAGETFDLIVCNAPFVVSPESRWAYRDSGLRGDDVTANVVREAASHLAENGYATLLGSWLVTDEDAPEERPLEWVEQTGCTGWIMTSIETDPLEHASSWNSGFFGDDGAYTTALDEWTGYLADLGASGVGEGAILLHRAGGKRAAARVDEIDEDVLEPAAKQIRQAFANRIRLAGMRERDVREARLERALPLRLEREIGSSTAELVLDGGTRSILPTTVAAVAVVEKLDGKTTLKSLGADGRALSLCRELLELGALRFA